MCWKKEKKKKKKMMMMVFIGFMLGEDAVRDERY